MRKLRKYPPNVSFRKRREFHKKAVEHFSNELIAKVNNARKKLKIERATMQNEQQWLEYENESIADEIIMIDLDNSRLVNRILEHIVENDKIEEVKNVFIKFLQIENYPTTYYDKNATDYLDYRLEEIQSTFIDATKNGLFEELLNDNVGLKF